MGQSETGSISSAKIRAGKALALQQSLSLKLLKIGIRESIIPILISYITDRQMIVKYEGAQSDPRKLVGGAPQGTLLAGIKYNIASSDCAAEVRTSSDKFRYYDDLNMLEFLILTELLTEYDYLSHVPSDVLANEPYLSPDKGYMQTYLNEVSDWTDENKMLLNEKKSNYIIFTRTKQAFSTRLKLHDVPLERLSVTKILGVWLQEDMGWDENTKQICRKAFSRVSILSKLKYAGICTEDLVTIYILFIKSLTV